MSQSHGNAVMVEVEWRESAERVDKWAKWLRKRATEDIQAYVYMTLWVDGKLDECFQLLLCVNHACCAWAGIPLLKISAAQPKWIWFSTSSLFVTSTRILVLAWKLHMHFTSNSIRFFFMRVLRFDDEHIRYKTLTDLVTDAVVNRYLMLLLFCIFL